jgi:hypothetical protein
MNDAIFVGSYETWVVTCPKHGEHPHAITSNIKGHEGQWCQLCWLESLGQPLPAVYKRVPFKENT